MACNENSSSLDDVLKSYGFSKLVPPSQLYGPGGLVYRANYDPDDARMSAVRLGYLCRPEFSVERYTSKPMESLSESSQLSSKLEGTFDLGVPVLNQLLGLNISASAARSASVTVSNVKLYAYARDDLKAIRGLIGSDCKSILRANIKTNNAYQVEQVIQASVSIKIITAEQINASARSTLVRELGALGAVGEAGDVLQTRGEALFYGVRLYPVDRL